MEKLDALKDHLITEFDDLKLRPETVMVTADNGDLCYHRGDENQNFKISYEANITVFDTAIAFNQIAYVLVQWLKDRGIHLPERTLRWSSVILSNRKADITIVIPLQETVKASELPEGIRLHSSHDNIIEQPGRPITECVAERAPGEWPHNA